MSERDDIEWLGIAAARPDTAARQAALQRQAQLAKPRGALGRLEQVAVDLAALQRTQRPRVDRVHIAVCVGDHGVAAEGVSAYPQATTADMVRNFVRGGAAINVVADAIGATLEVINLGTAHDPGRFDGVRDYRLGPGTASFTVGPAMTGHQLACALGAGRHAVERAHLDGVQLFIGGEMGIGNTTAATALACTLLDLPAARLAGPGTGLDAQGVAAKAAVVERALALHRPACSGPAETLRRLGGFEIAALVGAYVACAHVGLPALVDGYISSAAALLASRACPGADRWFLYAHASAEPGHRRILDALDARPLLDLDMRLGEGSGAAAAVPLLRLACDLHDRMATFGEAGVSRRSDRC